MRHPDYHDINKLFRHKEDCRDDDPLIFPGGGVDLFYPPFRPANAHYRLGHPPHNLRDRSVLTDFLDIERYGVEFEKFINAGVAHLSNLPSMGGVPS